MDTRVEINFTVVREVLRNNYQSRNLGPYHVWKFNFVHQTISHWDRGVHGDYVPLHTVNNHKLDGRKAWESNEATKPAWMMEGYIVVVMPMLLTY